VELKPGTGFRHVVDGVEFESNQSGIETSSSGANGGIVSEFESNQSGIETNPRVDEPILTPASLNRTRVELKLSFLPWSWCGSCRVWIEPEWNWNSYPAFTWDSLEEGLNRTRVELKHKNLNEMLESILLVWIEPEWNWNQTSHPTRLCLANMFESNQSGIETVPTSAVMDTFKAVWIEPEWNWNRYKQHLAPQRDARLNRTRVELKHSLAPKTIAVLPVWIEPEWNWNQIMNRSPNLNIAVWIEPEWNWNLRLF